VRIKNGLTPSTLTQRCKYPRRLCEMENIMKLKRVLFLFSSVAVWMLTSASATQGSDSLMTAELVRGNSDFAFSLYRALGKAQGNMCISPFSISAALAMTYAGAEGNTAKQMAAALRLAQDQQALHRAFKGLIDTLDTKVMGPGQELDLANGLCLIHDSLSPAFISVLKNNYYAEVFHGELEAINAWVKQKTKGNIPAILEQLAPNSVCVLLNAVYFKGMWQTPFKKDQTREMEFAVSAGKKVNAMFMYRKSKTRLFQGKDFQVLDLPYEGNRLSFVALLPGAVNGLPVLEQTVTADSLAHWLAEMNSRETMVFLPKIKLTADYDLVPYCKKLGMIDAFLQGIADFRGMGFGKGVVWISQIRHKAVMTVDEEGTEAAAATAVAMMRHGAPSDTPVFKADHPFLFVIRDNATGTIVFLGKVADPSIR